jgi:hypothetical protein
VTLTDYDPLGEEKVIAAAMYASSDLPDDRLQSLAHSMSADERDWVLRAYVGERGNRRHKPGRAFERTGYRFDVLCDYGAFRDLQRHRLLTLEWQRLSPRHGFDTPKVVADAGMTDEWNRVMEDSAATWATVADQAGPDVAQYAVSMAYRIRFVLQMSAREAIHLIELRSSPQGHPTYRRIAKQMHELIDTTAGHRAIAATMTYLDTSDVDLERLEAERRAEAKRKAARGRLSSLSRTVGAEDLGEIEADRLLELLERARARLAIGPPPDELRRVAEPIPLHVVVPDLDDPLGSERDEREVLLRVPAAALGAPRRPGLRHLLLPVPGVAVERRDPRLQLPEELPTAIHREGPDHPDVGEHPSVVVEPEQERPDGIRAALVEPVPGHDAVGGALVLDLEHHTPVLLVGPLKRLRHHPVEPRPLELVEPPPRDLHLDRGRRDVDRRPRVRERGLERGPTFGERTLQKVVIAEREQVERDEVRRGGLSKHPNAAVGGMDPLLERLELEPDPARGRGPRSRRRRRHAPAGSP